MKAHKKYYAADGTQLAVYFMEVMNITQDVNNSFSHAGTLNMDDGGKDLGEDKAYAPYDGNYGWVQTTGDDPTGVVFDSAKKVQTARLGKKYVIAFFWHDDEIPSEKGGFVPQGEHFYDEGTAGHATGNHIHFGVAVSDTPYNGAYPLVKNSKGNWEIRNEVNPWDVFFVNDTIIKNGRGKSWLVYKEVTPEPTPEPTPKPLPIVPTVKVGDRVKVIGDNYANGLIIPVFVKKGIYTVTQISRDGKKVLLDPIRSWVFIKDVRKVG
jgi:hypothetical protein